MLEEFGPGDVTFKEGDPGGMFYVIKSGTVDVVARAPNDTSEAADQLDPATISAT